MAETPSVGNNQNDLLTTRDSSEGPDCTIVRTTPTKGCSVHQSTISTFRAQLMTNRRCRTRMNHGELLEVTCARQVSGDSTFVHSINSAIEANDVSICVDVGLPAGLVAAVCDRKRWN